jgi:hypothetical protein
VFIGAGCSVQHEDAVMHVMVMDLRDISGWAGGLAVGVRDFR